ncbi:MAG: rhomboid family intramembrane serine protease [Lachnospiraceae bacterium]|nr:rhomboid family intramembrane serine protease [Lachnospiraceae bacterium]
MNCRIPLVTIIIVSLNVLGMAYELKIGEDFAIAKYGMYQGALNDGEWIRMLISGFLHFGVAHFGSNICCLILFGMHYEKEMGSVRYAVVYFAAVVGSSVLVNYIGGVNSIHAGASGGIWGLMTASLVYTIKNHENPIYVARGIAINLLYSFSAGISWQGHVGGGVAGLLVGAILFRDSYARAENSKKWGREKGLFISENSPVFSGKKCKDCGQLLSETVIKCPICGSATLSYLGSDYNKADRNNDSDKSEKESFGGRDIISIVVFLLFVVFVVLVVKSLL